MTAVEYKAEIHGRQLALRIRDIADVETYNQVARQPTFFGLPTSVAGDRFRGVPLAKWTSAGLPEADARQRQLTGRHFPNFSPD